VRETETTTTINVFWSYAPVAPTPSAAAFPRDERSETSRAFVSPVELPLRSGSYLPGTGGARAQNRASIQAAAADLRVPGRWPTSQRPVPRCPLAGRRGQGAAGGGRRSRGCPGERDGHGDGQRRHLSALSRALHLLLHVDGVALRGPFFPPGQLGLGAAGAGGPPEGEGSRVHASLTPPRP
jgi:hypothetical protein